MPGNSIFSIGRALIPDADLVSLSQAMGGDVFQVVLTDVFQPILTHGAVEASELIDLVVQLEATCTEEWLYTIAPDLATAQASTSDKWWPVLPNVEKILPMACPEDRIFVKQAPGGTGKALAVGAWGFKTPPPKDSPADWKPNE